MYSVLLVDGKPLTVMAGAGYGPLSGYESDIAINADWVSLVSGEA